MVKQTRDSSLSGRFGVVTQYIPPTETDPEGFVVRLGTRDMKFPTRFRGEKRFIEGKHLEHQRFHPSRRSRLPLLHPVVIMYYNSNKTPHHISFSLDKSVIEVINRSLPDGMQPNASFVQPFILSMKQDDNRNENVMKLNDDIDRMQYFKRNDIFRFEQVRHRRKKRKSIFSNCPCHQSTSCPFTRYCGPCSSQSNEEIKSDVISESSPSPDIGFQLETLLNPDACVIEIPFITKDSIIPSAALYLNELNVTPYKNKNHI